MTNSINIDEFEHNNKFPGFKRIFFKKCDFLKVARLIGQIKLFKKTK